MTERRYLNLGLYKRGVSGLEDSAAFGYMAGIVSGI